MIGNAISVSPRRGGTPFSVSQRRSAPRDWCHRRRVRSGWTKRHPCAQPESFWTLSVPCCALRVTSVVDPDRPEDGSGSRANGMPDDGAGRIRERGTGFNTSLDEVEVTVFGDRVVETPDAVVPLASQEEIRCLRRSILDLVLVILGAIHVDQRPNRSVLGREEPQAPGRDIRRLECREALVEPRRLGPAVGITEGKHRRA